MKNLILLLVVLFTGTFYVSAQSGKVVLCEDYHKTDGTPTGIHKDWDVSKDKGSSVYIIYSQESIIKDNLMLYVDKKNTNGSYIAFDTQEFTYKPQTDRKKWAMYDYKFTEAGDYRISVMGKGDDALAVTYTNIGYMAESTKSETSDDDVDTYYYENSTIVFGESIDADANVTGEAEEFIMKGSKREIFCKLEQDDALKCKQIVVSVYFGDDYDEKVSETTYNVGSMDWNWIKVPITVTKVGKYVVDIYNDNDVFINSAYFDIKR